MAYKFDKYTGHDPELIHATARGTIVKDTLTMWDTSGHGILAATSAGVTQASFVAGIAQMGGASADRIALMPWVPGLIFNTQYSTGTPAEGDLVEVVSATQVKAKATTASPAIARVLAVLDATAKTVRCISIDSGDINQ